MSSATHSLRLVGSCTSCTSASQLPNGGQIMDTIRAFIATVVTFVLHIPAAIKNFVQEHPEEFKIALIVVLGVVALIVAAYALCILVPAVLTFVVAAGMFLLEILQNAVWVVLKPVVWILRRRHLTSIY
ncbi:hypothetical protein C8Q74DRAFT_502864 [Fomes fomentarius]|nr:hypothetical protein C8Q74DRAFT_502864 [Fomes fomentarius]